MNFPTSFPEADLNVVLDWFKNHDAHSAREYAEAAFGLEGYALGQLFSAGKPLVLKAHNAESVAKQTCPNDKECVEVLTSLKESHTKPATDNVVGALNINWSQILSIVILILQQIK